MNNTEPWLQATLEVVDGYRKMVDAALAQLSDEELARRPAAEANSIAIILRHLGGNLQSRWTDFLTSDGEKPNRDRDTEFQDWPGSRTDLITFFDAGWRAMRDSLSALTVEDLTKSVTIRGEPHTVQLAIQRSLTHTSYHIGQIMLLARLVHDGQWHWLTIPPGGSKLHNQKTWGTPASRGVSGQIGQT